MRWIHPLILVLAAAPLACTPRSSSCEVPEAPEASDAGTCFLCDATGSNCSCGASTPGDRHYQCNGDAYFPPCEHGCINDLVLYTSGELSWSCTRCGPDAGP